MERSLTSLIAVAVVAVAFVCGCDDTPADPPARSAQEVEERREAFQRERAAKIARYQARRIQLIAEDMAKLNPRSERSDASREARKLLDKIVPRETANEARR